MATTKGRVAVVTVRNADQLAEAVNLAIETLEAAGFVPQVTEYRDDVDAQGLPVKVAMISSVNADFLPVNADVLGDLTTLTTTAKGSAVAAINEVDGDITTHLNGGANKHDASEVDDETLGGFHGATVQLSLDALSTEATRVKASYVEALFTNQADSAEIGNSTDELDFATTYAIPAGKVVEGDFIDVEFGVLVSGLMAGAGDLTIKAYIALQEIFSTTLTGAATNNYVRGRLRLKFWPMGGVKIEAQADQLAGLTQSRISSRGTGLANPALANTIKLTADFTAADLSNVCKLTDLTVTAAHIN